MPFPGFWSQDLFLCMGKREEMLDLCNLCDRKSIYGTRGLAKSSQISDWAGAHWSRDIGDLNRTLTCSGQNRDVFPPLNCLQGFNFKCSITFLSEEEKQRCGDDEVYPNLHRSLLTGRSVFSSWEKADVGGAISSKENDSDSITAWGFAAHIAATLVGSFLSPVCW